MDNDNKIVKYKGYIRKCAINILAWQENNPNPTTEEELKGLIELKGSLNDSIVNYCVLLSEEKANEIRVLKRKVSENIFSYYENIISGGWEKRTMVIPTKVQEHQKFLEETQGVPTDDDVIVGGN